MWLCGETLYKEGKVATGPDVTQSEIPHAIYTGAQPRTHGNTNTACGPLYVVGSRFASVSQTGYYTRYSTLAKTTESEALLQACELPAGTLGPEQHWGGPRAPQACPANTLHPAEPIQATGRLS